MFTPQSFSLILLIPIPPPLITFVLCTSRTLTIRFKKVCLLCSFLVGKSPSLRTHIFQHVEQQFICKNHDDVCV